MARLIIREFDKSKPTYARRSFIANGRKFQPGDEVNWRKMAISIRRATQMFEANLIGHDVVLQPAAVAVVEAEPVAELPVEVLGQSFDGAMDIDAIEDMTELRRIADEIGAPYKRSKEEQREAIKAHLNEPSAE